jgi:hypothetical protein
MRTRLATAVFTASLALGLATSACDDDVATNPDGALVEVTPDCLECMRTLTECTSTAKSESQFSGCRDVFGACQDTMGLGPDECGRPTNAQGCELCRDRFGACAGSPKDCEGEFSVCKAFLMTRERDACAAVPEAPTGSCQTCVDTLAGCTFGGGESSVCEASFFSCRNANGIEPADCPGPSPEEACGACQTQHEGCLATGSTDCDAGWSKCVAGLATESACGAGPSHGGAGGGDAGAGGGAPAEPACPHDACETGDAMSAACDACIAEVCAEDAFCCEGTYDELCVERATTIAACGCAPAAACAHEPCAEGELLDANCDPCATTVCAQDGYCCNTAWDALCVGYATELCGLACGG